MRAFWARAQAFRDRAKTPPDDLTGVCQERARLTDTANEPAWDSDTGAASAIIAMDELGATGGQNGEAFTLAVIRASEICIGIVSAGIVLVATDFGGARGRLATQLAALSFEITGRLSGAFRLSRPEQADTREVRRDLIRRVIALDPVIDEAIGEASVLRYRSRVLQAAVGGLFAALSGWRTIANHLERLPNEEGRRDAEIILQNIPPALRSGSEQDNPAIWAAEPSRLRGVCMAAVRSLTSLPAGTPSLRLLADRTAEALLGLAQALNGVMLLVDDRGRDVGRRAIARLHVPDWLLPLVSAARTFATIGAVQLLWILTGWPNGGQAMTFAAVGVILFSPKADQAYALTRGFLIGNCLSAALAAIVKFAVLPHLTTFAGFSLAIGLVLVPGGAFAAQPWQTGMFVAMTANFIPLLAPANAMSYDTQQFYNGALGIIGGGSIAAISFRLLPPLPPALRARRLLTLTLRDLRRLATEATLKKARDWEGRTYSRLSVLPEGAEPIQRAQLVAALSVGTEIIRLRRIADRFDLGVDLGAALDAFVRGQSALAAWYLTRVDRTLAAIPSTGRAKAMRLRARGSVLAILETITQYSSYFDSGARR